MKRFFVMILASALVLASFDASAQRDQRGTAADSIVNSITLQAAWELHSVMLIRLIVWQTGLRIRCARQTDLMVSSLVLPRTWR